MVRDNGAGFDRPYADKLFQPFQRLHSQGAFAKRWHRPGIGEAHRGAVHGGGIRAEGQPGQGCDVRVHSLGDAFEDAPTPVEPVTA